MMREESRNHRTGKETVQPRLAGEPEPSGRLQSTYSGVDP